MADPAKSSDIELWNDIAIGMNNSCRAASKEGE
jgi:hypothetical protein